MLIRISGTLRSISMIVLLLVFLYVYANLPEMVGVNTNESGHPTGKFSRNSFFYGGLFIFSLVNGLLLILIRLYKKTRLLEDKYNQTLITWLNGLSGFINLFFMMSVIFVSAFNSLEKINLNNFGIILNITGGILLIWLLGFFYVRLQKGK